MVRLRFEICTFALLACAVAPSWAFEPEILSCRCEYPLEDVYTNPFSMQQQTLPGLTYDTIEDFILEDDVLIIPQEHEACRYLQYVCDGNYARFPFWEGRCQIHPNHRPPTNAFAMKGMMKMGMRKKGMLAGTSSPSKKKIGKGMEPQNGNLDQSTGEAYQVQKETTNRKKMMMMMMMKKKKKKKKGRNLKLESRRPVEATQALANFEEEVNYRQQTWYAQWGEPWRTVVLPSDHPYCVEPPSRGTDGPVDEPDPTPSIGFADSPTDSPSESPTTSTPTTPVPTEQPRGAVPVTGTFAPFPSGRNPGRTPRPSDVPSLFPSLFPSMTPSFLVTPSPTRRPTQPPTEYPTKSPTESPTDFPTMSPTDFPTPQPTDNPTPYPTPSPFGFPTEFPSNVPSKWPSMVPSSVPSKWPSMVPSSMPSKWPSVVPSTTPSGEADVLETFTDTENTQSTSWYQKPIVQLATLLPTANPTQGPTKEPTKSPVPPSRQIALGFDQTDQERIGDPNVGRLGDMERDNERDDGRYDGKDEKNKEKKSMKKNKNKKKNMYPRSSIIFGEPIRRPGYG